MDGHKTTQPLRELKIKWPKLDVTVTYTRPEYKVSDRANEPDGSVFLSSFQHLAIKYGRVTEHHPAAPCGNVISEDLKKLRWLGNEVWKSRFEKKQPIEVILWDASKPETDPKSLPLCLQRTGATKEVKGLVQGIHEETEKSWSSISDDVSIIHSGRAPSYPGSKDSYFAAMLFANSEHLVVLYREFLAAPAEFLGYVGTEFLRDSHRKIDNLITLKVQRNPDQEEAREGLLAMVSVLAQYTNLLNAQNLHLFPWKHTTEYPQATASH
ncbi:hypothetical protein NUH16_003382 [Penicillium rubens]|nr:hypothetical protein NUH16_003382 [Penicillium rubens]